MALFMRNTTVTKQHACEHRKWEMLSPTVPVSLAVVCREKENKIYKAASLWSGTWAAGEPRKETKNPFKTIEEQRGCAEKTNPSHLNSKGFKGEIKYYLLRYKNHFWNNNPIKKKSHNRLQPSISGLTEFAFFSPSHCWAQCFINVIQSGLSTILMGYICRVNFHFFTIIHK